MKKLFGKLTVALAIVGAVAMVGQNTAFAENAAVLVGQGTITPGLGATFVPQSFTFTTIAGAGASDKPATAALVSCTFSGHSTLAVPGQPAGENAVLGEGVGSGTCNGGGISANCAIVYIRVGPFVVVVYGPSPPLPAGFCSNGQDPVGVFVFVPTSVNPTNSYVLAGAAATV
jgi:hypothetical protein